MYPLALRLFINARTLDMGYPSSDEISVRVSAFWRSANRSSIASTRSADLTEADGPVLVLFSDMVASEKRRAPKQSRSEEHTSELQSLMRIAYAGFCLKKQNKQNW